METPGNGPPRPVIVPLIVHVAAAGGACCAPSAVPSITTAIAAPLTVVDILRLSWLEAWLVAAYAFRSPATKTKRCPGAEWPSFYFLYLYLTSTAPSRVTNG